MRDWVNGRAGLTGKGNPLANGAFLREQASPVDGAYAVVHRVTGTSDIVAEPDTGLATAGIGFLIYSAGEDVAERAAAALASAVETLTGVPEPCGDSGVVVLVSDKLQGPVFVPQPDDREEFCFQVSAEFTLADFS